MLHAVPRPKPLRVRFSGTPQKCGLGWACILCLPHLSSSGSQELDRRILPGCGAPSPLRGPSLSFHACWSGAPCVCSGELISGCYPPCGCQPSRISESLWLETGSLFAVGRGAVSGAEFAPFPSPLPPARDDQGAAS